MALKTNTQSMRGSGAFALLYGIVGIACLIGIAQVFLWEEPVLGRRVVILAALAWAVLLLLDRNHESAPEGAQPAPARKAASPPAVPRAAPPKEKPVRPLNMFSEKEIWPILDRSSGGRPAQVDRRTIQYAELQQMSSALQHMLVQDMYEEPEVRRATQAEQKGSYQVQTEGFRFDWRTSLPH